MFGSDNRIRFQCPHQHLFKADGGRQDSSRSSSCSESSLFLRPLRDVFEMSLPHIISHVFNTHLRRPRGVFEMSPRCVRGVSEACPRRVRRCGRGVSETCPWCVRGASEVRPRCVGAWFRHNSSQSRESLGFLTGCVQEAGGFEPWAWAHQVGDRATQLNDYRRHVII